MVRAVVIGVIAGCVGVAIAADSGGKPFSSEDGRFTVSFPAQPTETRKNVTNPDVVADVRYEARRNDVTYMAGFIAYAQATAEGLDAVDPAEFAAHHRDSTVKGTTGEVLSQTDVTIGKEQRPGYELVIKISPKLYLRQRVCYSRGKLYQLMVAGASQDAVTGPNATTFLESFTVAE